MIVHQLLCVLCFIMYGNMILASKEIPAVPRQKSVGVLRPKSVKNKVDTQEVVDQDGAGKSYEVNGPVAKKLVLTPVEIARKVARDREVANQPEAVRPQAQAGSKAPKKIAEIARTKQGISLKEVDVNMPIESVSKPVQDINLRQELGKPAAKQPIRAKKPVMIDVNQVDLFHDVQRVEKGVPARFDAQKMTDPIDVYIDVLKSRPENARVVDVAPELLATYAIESTIRQPRVYNPKQMAERELAREWQRPNERFNLENLYMGLKKFNQLLNGDKNHKPFQIYDTSYKNEFMSDPVSGYVEALRQEFSHVPDALLKTYVTEYLKNQYEMKSEWGWKGLIPGRSLIPDITKPLKSSPIKMMEEFRELDLPMTEQGMIDNARLTQLQEIYLTIKSVESINKSHVELYQRVVQADRLKGQAEQTFEQKKAATLESPGSEQFFFLQSGVNKKNIANPTLTEINNALQALQDNYPSYQEFKSNRQDRMAFEQLQLDFINLNQDIFVMAQKYNIKLDATLVSVENPKTIREKVQNLLRNAVDFRNNMNKVIVEQKVIDVLSQAPSDQSFQELQLLYSDIPVDQQNMSLMDQVEIAQDNMVRKQVRDILEKINNKTVGWSQAQLADEIFLLEQKEQVEKNLQNFEKNKVGNQENILIAQGLIRKVDDRLEHLQRSEQAIQKESTLLLEKFFGGKDQFQALQEQLSAVKQGVVTKLDEHNQQIVDEVVLKSLRDLQQRLAKQKPLDRDMIRIVDQLVEQYSHKDFKDQKIEDITKQIVPEHGLAANEIVKVYHQFYLQLDTMIKPLQSTLNKVSKLEHLADACIRAQSGSIGKAIKDITARIANLEKNTSSDGKNKFISSKKEKDLLNELLKDFADVEKFTNQDRTQLIQTYKEILEKLQEKQANTPTYQFTDNLWQGLQNIRNRQFGQAKEKVAGAAGHAPQALGQVHGELTNYVNGILGTIKDNLTPTALVTIAGIISTVAPMIIAIQQSDVSDDEKHKMQQDVLAALVADVGNVVIADRTGANVDVIATRDAQAIATSSLFNKAINLLTPNDPAGFSYNSSVNSPTYVSNVSKFQAQYHNILTNQYGTASSTGFGTNAAYQAPLKPSYTSPQISTNTPSSYGSNSQPVQPLYGGYDPDDLMSIFGA